ncbi:hypothetical protein EVAR_21941_1 [Eumeta japonica]|uniref:Uncharacterized protein n=1 Tax=Eumeta variegata TaxID=151549 RepID=A0A4C1XJT5_EUMVA|nr:hypothetical protein EVAR_21941_1 [Eumeta japonica]
MKDASKRFLHRGIYIPQLLRAAVDYQPPPPPTLSVDHGTWVIDRPHPNRPAAARPGGVDERNRPVTVSSDAYAEMTPFRSRPCHACPPHVPSAALDGNIEVVPLVARLVA